MPSPVSRRSRPAAPQTLFLPDLLHDPDTRQRFMQTLDQYGQVDAMEAQIGTHAPRWSSLSARLIDVGPAGPPAVGL